MIRKQLEFKETENAVGVAKLLIAEGYVVMLSREEQFTILNYILTCPDSDGSHVVFMDREEFEEEYFV